MKLLLVLLCAVMCHYCNGYTVTDGETSEEVLNVNATSVDYFLDSTNDTSTNDSLQHGFFKKVGGGIKGGIKSIKTKIGNIKNKIGGGFKDNSGSGKSVGGGHYIGGRYRPNPGSGVKDPENAKWALLGIGIILIVTAVGLTSYYCYKIKSRRVIVGEVQQVNKV